ncbi:phospholipase D/nuclease [Hesseltinella vesiculosa]|uniref:Mitochondrial cardiolipin hydrolase n=1 Tax=Hesseltinella vesiculosa TaxID=101127 RepID=A0A1X2GHY1_9FUNG|nr:phospholipase D/nuclease [Hesseltinella vesiculosa]
MHPGNVNCHFGWLHLFLVSLCLALYLPACCSCPHQLNFLFLFLPSFIFLSSLSFFFYCFTIMDKLIEILCNPSQAKRPEQQQQQQRPPSAPAGPPLRPDDLKKDNFDTLLQKTLANQSFMENGVDKKQISDLMTKSLKAKSHSVNNTRRTVQQVFDVSIEQSRSAQQKQMLQWMRFCVDTCLGFQEDGSDNATPKPTQDKDDATVPATQKRAVKKTAPRYDVIDDSDDNYEPSDGGEDSDAYVPVHDALDNAHDVDSDSDADDQAVPDSEKKKPAKKKPAASKTKTTRKKEPDLPPFIQPNAGAKAVTSYFTTTHADAASTKNGLGNGYYAKAYFFPSKESFNAFGSVLNSAQKTIDICVFSITDDDVADILIAAKQRNVAVRIITDNQQAAIKGADAARLQQDYGIPYKTDHTTGYMHNKFAVVDSKTLINGSFNWSKGARFKNRENIMITNLPHCIKEFETQFAALWDEF